MPAAPDELIVANREILKAVIETVVAGFPPESVVRPVFRMVDSPDRPGQFDVTVAGGSDAAPGLVEVELGTDAKRVHDLLIAAVMRMVLADLATEMAGYSKAILERSGCNRAGGYSDPAAEEYQHER